MNTFPAAGQEQPGNAIGGCNTLAINPGPSNRAPYAQTSGGDSFL